MEMPASQAVFATTPQARARADLFTLATLWRGAMLECFARMERAIAGTFVSLAECGVDLPADARHQAAVNRARALAQLLNEVDFGGYGPATTRKLDAYVGLADLRNALAHGTVTISGPFAVFVVGAFRDGRWAETEVQYPALEMLVRLHEVRNLQRALACQLGQLVPAARRRNLFPHPL